jgi:molecular chaperone HscB
MVEKIDETLADIEKLVSSHDWPAVKTAAIRLKYLLGIDAAGHAWPDTVSDH